MSETALSRSIQDAFKELGIWCLRLNAGKVKVRGGWMKLCEPGTPDLLVLNPLLFLELKTAKGKEREAQLEWHARAAREGIPVAVVRSVAEAFDAVSKRRP